MQQILHLDQSFHCNVATYDVFNDHVGLHIVLELLTTQKTVGMLREGMKSMHLKAICSSFTMQELKSRFIFLLN